MAAVNKVVQMLEDLQAQVLAEGEAEAATYNKFACFCKTTQKDKSDSIATGKTDKESLMADIKKFTSNARLWTRRLLTMRTTSRRRRRR